MRTIRTKVYKFNELTEDAQAKAIEKFRYNWDDSEWAFENTVEDASQVGLSIQSLDDHRPNKGEFDESATDTANKIIENHGAMCETYKTAQRFLKSWAELVAKWSDGVKLDEVAEDNEYDFDKEAEELESDFLQEILEDYRILYNQDIEYQTSDEYIIETLIANEYEFTKDGNRF